jgi:DnaJ-class molecular chaperone
MCGIQCDKLSPRSRSPAKQDLWNKSDTVQFSQEALDRLELLKQRQTKDVLRETQTIREKDSQLEKSLKILEIDRGSSVEEIRKAYLHAIQHYHPDKHAYLPPEFRQLAEITSKRINELYSALLKCKTGNPRRS